jgi:hypothetical protein
VISWFQNLLFKCNLYRYAEDDDVFTEGLTLLTQSMRKPLWNLWSRPEERPDEDFKDPKVYGHRGLTRVHLNPLHASFPRGGRAGTFHHDILQSTHGTIDDSRFGPCI